jgi:hypothetical protein
MNAKLTLTIDGLVIEKAKKYAKKREYSLSALIENYLRTITINNDKKEKTTTKPTPIVKSLKGSFSPPENFDYKKELSEKLSEKYL